MQGAFDHARGWIGRWGSRTLVVSGLLLAVVAPVGEAWAEQSLSVQRAREFFMRGVASFQNEDYEAALADFVRAYELAPHYGVQYNIGRVQMQLRHFPEALVAFDLYLREGGDEIPAPRRAEVRRELRRLRQAVGWLRVNVSQPSHAVVHIDGTEVGQVPLSEPVAVSAGRHVVEVRADGHLPSRRSVMVAGGSVRQVTMSLQQSGMAGGVFFSSNVTDVAIRVDGTEVGRTPLEGSVRLSPGAHLVEASRPGYRLFQEQIRVLEGQLTTVEIELVQEEMLDDDVCGDLDLEVSEPGAEVFVDGRLFSGQPLPVGGHQVDVRRPGFMPWMNVVDVAPVGRTQVSADLVPTEEYLAQYRRRARMWRALAWTATVLAVGTAAAGFGLLGYFYPQAQDLEEERARLDTASRDGAINPATGVPYTVYELSDWHMANEQRNERLKKMDVTYGVLLGVAGLFAVQAVLAFALGPNPRRYDSLAWTVGPQGFQLALHY